MKISSNYNLSFNKKTNNQKSKTNPSFGINTKNITFPLAAGAGAIYGVTHKLIPFESYSFLAMAKKTTPESTDLPADKKGYTKLHHLCEDGKFEAVKKILNENPNINLSQMAKDGNTCMSLAIKNKRKDIVDLIANTDNYNPTIPDKYGKSDLYYLCKNNNSDIYTDIVITFLRKYPDFDINQQEIMKEAVNNKNIALINLIAGLDMYNPTTPDKNGWTDLHSLCEKGYADVVKTLLEKHPEIDINQQSKSGYTCMSVAIGNWNKDIINLIAGMDNYNPTITNEYGLTNLHRLCEYGYTDAVKTLLKKHPDFDINQQTKDGDTCMSLAIDKENEDIINLIAGMDNYKPDIPNERGWTDLHYLCEHGYTDVVKILLKKHPEIDFSQQTNDRYTCMSLAIKNNHKDIIDLITGMDNYKPDIPNKYGWTDLHLLCKNGYTDAVKTLLEKHPEIDFSQQTKNGGTCMSLAIRYDQKDIINLIANADNYKPDIPNEGGWTDFHSLCQRGYTDFVKTLLDKHPEFDINQQTNDGYSCMSLAVINMQKGIIDLIAGMDNFDPAVPDKDGRTDLHRLCEFGYTDVVKTLLEKHPDIDFNQKSKSGNTYMSVAALYNHKDIIDLISGMDNYNPVIPDKDGRTDLHRLCDAHRTEAIGIILKNKPNLNINQFTNGGFSCMTIAIANKYEDLINLIAGYKNYNPLIINKFGANDLHYLCREGYTDAVKTIIDNNPDADLNQLTVGGYSYIDLAILNNHTDIVKIISDKISGSGQEKPALNLQDDDSAKHNAGRETDKEQAENSSWTNNLIKKGIQFLSSLRRH